MTWIILPVIVVLIAVIISRPLYERFVKADLIVVDAVVGESKWNKSKHEKSHYDAELSYTVDGKEFRAWLPLNKYDGSPYDIGTTVKIVCNRKYPKKIYSVIGKVSVSGKM